MLRIVRIRKKPPTELTQDREPNVYTWTYQFHRSDTKDEISTIQLTQYQWKKLSLPKKQSLHTSAKLKVWFRKLIAKKYSYECQPFSLFGSDYHSVAPHTTHPPKTRTYVRVNVMFIPLFQSLSHELESLHTIPPVLKLELQKQNIPDSNNETDDRNWTYVCG